MCRMSCEFDKSQKISGTASIVQQTTGEAMDVDLASLVMGKKVCHVSDVYNMIKARKVRTFR